MRPYEKRKWILVRWACDVFLRYLVKYTAFVILSGTNVISNSLLEVAVLLISQSTCFTKFKSRFPLECTRLFILIGESYLLSAKWMKTLWHKDNRNCILIKWSKSGHLIFFTDFYSYAEYKYHNSFEIKKIRFRKKFLAKQHISTFMELLLTEKSLFILWKFGIDIYLRPQSILSLKSVKLSYLCLSWISNDRKLS